MKNLRVSISMNAKSGGALWALMLVLNRMEKADLSLDP